MSPSPADKLNEVRTFSDVLEYFVDVLDWPLSSNNLEKSTFDYTPEELGISESRSTRFGPIRELIPVTTQQPWGIFFLEFSGQRLPITLLRELLLRLVTKRRSHGSGEHRTWDLADLLFIVTTDSGNTVELHLVAFAEVDGKTPQVRSLPWRPGLSPHQHLHRLASELLPQLHWPTNPSDPDAWRAQWHSAFVLQPGEAITTASRLAERMAEVATRIRTLIEGELHDEEGHGPFSDLQAEVRTELVAELGDVKFADMCAQTLVYGVLTARVTDPTTFGASPLLSSIPLANPFLAAFFQKIHEQALDLELGDSGLEGLVADLRESNVEHVLDQFGASGSHSDPVIHFYEEFLKKYDNDRRVDVGAFYTPRPVVEFMVRSVDQVLRTEFGLDDGIADMATWTEVADQNDFKVPGNIDPTSRFVSMIDPATGTGTFLIEWLRQAKKSFTTSHPEIEWSIHLAEHVLPSIRAFELMLGPYAIAHLKLALECHENGISMDPNTVLLTDTLEKSDAKLQRVLLEDPVAAEGLRASSIKDAPGVSICIGNPPYARSAHAADGGWIADDSEGFSPFTDFLNPLSEAGLAGHAKLIYEQSIYFWRWALWKVFEQNRSPGIISFISPRAYIDSPGHSGVRKWMRETLDELWILDLGGDNRGANRSPNVFDIETGVAIGIGVRYKEPDPNQPARIWYHEVQGSREEKLRTLSTATIGSLEWVACPGADLDLFLPSGPQEYKKWPDIAQLFPWRISGSQFKRLWPIAEDRETLHSRWDLLKEISAEYQAATKSTHTPTSRQALQRLQDAFGETADRKVEDPPRGRPTKKFTGLVSLHPKAPIPEAIEYGYRAFDRQWVLWDDRFGDRVRAVLAATRGDKQIFFASLMTKKLGPGPGMTATDRMPDMDFFCNRGAADILPMWRNADATEPNVTTGLLDALAIEYEQFPSVEDLFAYVVAIMGAPAYQTTFQVGLRRPGPRIPITKDRDLFLKGVQLGRKLVWYQTYGCRWAPEDHPAGRLPAGKAQFEKEISTSPADYPTSFDYNESTQTLRVGDGLVSQVDPSVFEYEQSAFKVVKAWLGYRMRDRSGRAGKEDASELDSIRPPRWKFSDELLELLWAVEGCVGLWPEISRFVEDVVTSETFSETELPQPAPAEKKKPKVSASPERNLFG